MKRQTNSKKQLRLSTETIRKLDRAQLGEVAGGLYTNNGCAGSGWGPTLCQPCFE